MDQQPVVLLADHDVLVGLDLGDALERAGYRVLGPFPTTAEALSAIERQAPALAIIDVALRDGSCVNVAVELCRRGVPFLVHSGLQQDELMEHEFKGAPWLMKPALPRDIVELVHELAVPAPRPALDAPVLPMKLVLQTTGRPNPFVRKLEGFTVLSDADRAMLDQISAETRIVAPNTDLVREGNKPEGVFVVMEGIACRHKMRTNGARQITAYLVPGDICDLDVALLNQMDHTITTLSACKVVRIAPGTIANLIEHHPAVARALRMTTLVDEATLREWLVNVGCRSAVERIAHLFCELFVRLRAVGLAEQDAYELPITQATLADTTGLTPVHVNRTLQALRRQGLVEWKAGRLTILDLPRLRALAEFKPNYLHLGERAAA